MGWSYGLNSEGREVGYAVDATCDHDGCDAKTLTEGDVWRRAHNIGSEDSSVWYGALRTLVERGLAQRTGRRGGYQWYITSLGKAAL